MFGVRRGLRSRSERAVAQELGLSRESVGKMLRYAAPPGHQRQQPIRRPKLGPWLDAIDAILPPQRRRPVAGDPGWKKTSGGLPGSGTRRSGSLSGCGRVFHSTSSPVYSTPSTFTITRLRRWPSNSA